MHHYSFTNNNKTNGNISWTAKKSIYLETQNEEALQRLRYLEDTSRYQRKTITEETVTQAPVFTMPIKDLKVAENQAAHFEARVIPVGDSKLKVEWLRNGVAISACKLHSKLVTIVQQALQFQILRSRRNLRN